MKISQIKIGNRSRKDLGDIASLARSIEAIGLLHPIVVLKDGTLIAGARRIAAFVQLGKDEIPHTTVESLNEAVALLMAERDENMERKDFSPSEAVAMAERLEPLEKEEARKRQSKAGPKVGKGAKATASENCSTAVGRASDHVASAVGMSRPTLAKAKAVIEAAKLNPDACGPIADRMDQTGNIHGAFRELAATAVKSQIRKMAAESQAEMEQATAWMEGTQLTFSEAFQKPQLVGQ